MKKIWFLLFLFPCLLFAQDKPQPANDILTAAYKRASEENKNVFVIFHASWCGWCKKMDASMNNSLCKHFFDDNYIIVHLTVHENGNKKKNETPGAGELLKENGAFDAGLPFWLVYNSNGKVLATGFLDSSIKKEIIGCPASAKEIAAFTAILKATSSLSDKELEIITTVFRKNED